MGQRKSKAIADCSNENRTWKESWQSARKGIFGSSSNNNNTAATNDVPSDNIFVSIQKDNILPQIPIGRHHPAIRKGVEDNDKRTMHTNKFYANAFLGDQNKPIWTHPYSIWWSKGWQENNLIQTWGMCVTHVEKDDLHFAPGDPSSSYSNPLRKQCLILSARELNQETLLTTDTHLPFSVNINLSSTKTPQESRITFPVVQGMSFVTAGYRNGTPTIQTGGKGFVDFGPAVSLGRSAKYRCKDMDGRDWLIYVNPAADSNYDVTKFNKVDPNTVIGASDFKGTIQVAKKPLGVEGEALYDNAFGTFVCEATVTATVNESNGSYAFNYTKIGNSPLLMFVLPHHLQSLDPPLKDKVTKLQLRTSTKGTATAVWTDKVSCTESNLPTSMHFGPWSPTNSKPRYAPDVLSLIAAAAERDLRRVMTEPITQDSMYYAGKTLAKFATIIWVIKDVLSNDILAGAGLEKLKQEISRYVKNEQLHPLYYDDYWKGVVSNAGFPPNDPNADFGNTFYNDHHFHFGYFVYTAAVIGYLDPGWLATNNGENKSWTNMLIKDFAESDYNGRDYPFSRSFDWWHGHSWAKGLYESGDGKDQESTSEDGFASFAIKMWGKIVGDTNMEKRGNLMLAIQARSLGNYFYLQSGNANQPTKYVGNKVTGILFENKVDYTTYFGNSPQFIHGIHMVPLSPPSVYLRPRQFVAEEWDKNFTNGRADVEGGWRGILYANLALVDAKESHNFFRNGNNGFWDEHWIDGGASRTWYLVWSAALMDFAKK